MKDTTTAKEIMTTDLVKVTEDMTIEEVLKVLINYRITGLPVVDKKGNMTGVVSEYDILKQISKSKKNNEKIYQQRFEYTKKVDFVSEDTPLPVVVDQFIERKFRRLPVTDKKGKLVGMITRRDLMRVYYYRARLSG
jgi:CBS domain-containing protein